jgi:hypothetical protein
MLSLMMLVLLIPAATFAWWGYIERDPESYVLASIYLAGSLIGIPVLYFLTAHS